MNKKKNSKILPLLLVIPFVIGLITFISVKALTNLVESDIAGISFSYAEYEGFKINSVTELKAEPIITDEKVKLKEGADKLKWTVENDGEYVGQDPLAEMEEKDDIYYLKANELGLVKVTCYNEIETQSKSFFAEIYDKGIVIINPEVKGSGNSVYSTRNFGQYDLNITKQNSLDGYNKTNANVKLDVKVYSASGEKDNTVTVKEKTDNIAFQNNTITINGSGKGSITLSSVYDPSISSTYNFNIIEDGVNIYSYNELLMATNFSSKGEVVVMQVSLDSYENIYKVEIDKDGNKVYTDEIKDPNNTAKLFGNVKNYKDQIYNFENELKEVETTYNSRYIDQYNATQNKSNKISKNIKTGIYLQKDFYGNGFSINMHQLAYPNHGKFSSSKQVYVPDPELDYFFGPLPYFFIGNPKMPLIKAFGQDNAGLYVASDNITIDDANIQNTNNVDNMYNLVYSGSVVDISNANNVTIKNSTIQNGRTAVRAFSSNNLNITNSILQNAGEFIIKAGTNEFADVDINKEITLNLGYQIVKGTFKELFIDKDSNNQTKVDSLFEQALFSRSVSVEQATDFLNQVQEALDSSTNKKQPIITITDTALSNSGVFAIGLETMFNGIFLNTGGPTKIEQYFDKVGGMIDLDYLAPKNIGGTSLGVKVNVKGDTRFYDWKDIDTIDLSFLIEENVIAQIGDASDIITDFDIDRFFPVKKALKNIAINDKFSYQSDENKDGKNEHYINRTFAYYGGGFNNSKHSFDRATMPDYNEYSRIDIKGEHVSSILNMSEGTEMDENKVFAVLGQCVIAAIGTNEFRFIPNNKTSIKPNQVPKFFNERPKASFIKDHLK